MELLKFIIKFISIFIMVIIGRYYYNELGLGFNYAFLLGMISMAIGFIIDILFDDER